MPPKKYMIIALVVVAILLIGVFVGKKYYVTPPLSQGESSGDTEGNTGVFIFMNKSSQPSGESKNIPVNYGEIVKYEINKPVYFRDFSITYLGVTTNNVPNSSLKIVTHQFMVSSYILKDGVYKTQKEGWSSGLGDIAPTRFEFDGKKYSLEKAMSDDLGKLEENEMVIKIYQ